MNPGQIVLLSKGKLTTVRLSNGDVCTGVVECVDRSTDLVLTNVRVTKADGREQRLPKLMVTRHAMTMIALPNVFADIRARRADQAWKARQEQAEQDYHKFNWRAPPEPKRNFERRQNYNNPDHWT